MTARIMTPAPTLSLPRKRGRGRCGAARPSSDQSVCGRPESRRDRGIARFCPSSRDPPDGHRLVPRERDRRSRRRRHHQRGRGGRRRAGTDRDIRHRAERLHRRGRGARARQGQGDRRGARGEPPARAACRRAVRGQEPVLRRGPADARRLQDQSRPRAGGARRHRDRAPRSAGRRAGGRAQHGRIRLRLHRRERA